MESNVSTMNEGLRNIEIAYDALNKASIHVKNASQELEKGIGEVDYSRLLSHLSSSMGECKIIIQDCNNYINETREAEKKIEELLSGSSTIFDKSEHHMKKIVGYSLPLTATPPPNGTSSKDDKVLDTEPESGIESVESGEYLNEEETNRLMLFFSYNNGEEMEEEDIYAIIESSDYLTPEDKDYITHQLDLGNVRAAMQYIVVKMTQEDLDAVIAKNQPRIDEINAILLKPEYSRDNIRNDPRGFTYAMARLREVMALEAEREQLRGEISSTRRLLNQYKLSNKMWEYDCYFKLIGTEEFDDAIVPYEFFSTAMEFYSSDDYFRGERKKRLRISDKYDLIEFIGNDNGAYIDWLRSDECTIENKEKLIEFYERTYGGESNIDPVIFLYDLDLDPSKFVTFEALGLVENNYNLTPDERKVFAYIYLTQGERKAEEFLRDFEQIINMRGGVEDAYNIFYNIIGASENNIGVLGADWEGVKVGTKQWFSRVGKVFDNSGVMTREDYSIMYVNCMLSGVSYLTELTIEDFDDEDFCSMYGIDETVKEKMIGKIKEGKSICVLDVALETKSISQEEYDSFIVLRDDERVKNFIERNKAQGFLGMSHQDWIKYSFNAGVSTGNMLPSIVMSILTKGAFSHIGVSPAIAEKAGKFIALGGMGVYSYSSSKAEAIRNGRSLSAARLYAVLSATGESVSDYFIGGVPFVSKGVKWLEVLPKDKWFVKCAKFLLGTVAVHPAMESGQEEFELIVWDPLSEYIAYGENNFGLNWDAIKDTAITTYLSTFQLQVASISVPIAGSLIKRNQVALVLKSESGNKIKITCGELVQCIDKKTGKISQEKINALIESKLAQFDTTTAIEGQTVVYSEEQITQMKLDIGKYKNGHDSEIVLDKLIEIYEQQMRRGNPNIEREIASTIAFLERGITIKLVVGKKGSQYKGFTRTLEINVNDLNDGHTIPHEFEHGKQAEFTHTELDGESKLNRSSDNFSIQAYYVQLGPVFLQSNNSYYIGEFNYTRIIENIRSKLNANPNHLFWRLNDYFEGVIRKNAAVILAAGLQENHLTLDEGIEKQIPNVQKLIEQNGLKTVMDNYGLGNLYHEGMEIDHDLLYKIADLRLSEWAMNKARSNFLKTSTFGKFTDIADAIFGGTLQDSKVVTNGHGVAYYGGVDVSSSNNSYGVYLQYAELLAQFDAMLTASPDSIKVVRGMFGDEFTDMMLYGIKVINDNAGAR